MIVFIFIRYCAKLFLNIYSIVGYSILNEKNVELGRDLIAIQKLHIAKYRQQTTYHVIRVKTAHRALLYAFRVA